jgi:ATP-binding cassette, subfamily B, bacterial
MKKMLKIPIRQYAQLLAKYLKPQWGRMTALGLLLTGGIAMQLISPQLIRQFLDTAENGGSLESLWLVAGLFIGISLIHQLLTVIATYLSENIGWIATNRLRGDVAEHCLQLDQSFHKKHTTGSLIERVDGDINALANFFSSFIIHLLTNAVLMIGIIILLFREHVWVGVGMTLFVAFALWSIRYIRQFAVPHWTRMRQVNAEFYGLIGEHLEGTEDTRANGATGYVLHRFFTILREWLPVRIRAFMGWASMWIASIIVFTAGNALAFVVSASLWKTGSITMGTVYMIFYYTELLAKPIEKIRTQMEDLQKADASIHRIKELLETRSAIEDGPGANVARMAHEVAFRQVVFGYEPGSTTLKGIDLTLKPGRVLGLLGRTGSGKTTMARMLLRFYDPQEGSIQLNGVDLRQFTIHELRQHVGLVTQNIELFEGTVRDNLTFYDTSIEDSKMISVLEELGLGEWLHSLPLGLDTKLESRGAGLSAGEAQLLAFARVFLRDPGVIILDEASSRLDPATEHRIEQALGRLLEGRTCIIIAHRLATVQRADDILILEDGQIVEYGERSQLAEQPDSRFSRMLSIGLEEVLV